MKLIPLNNHILVSIQAAAEEMETKEKSSGFFIPEQLSKNNMPYKVVRVETSCESLKPRHPAGQLVLVEAHMLEEVVVRGNTFHIIPVNAIKAIVEL